MATQKFSSILREAIWIAHGKKCAYTHEVVDLASLHIDHIIPESLASHPEEVAALKMALGLDDTFDLHGLENLLPCKPGPNLQKADVTLIPASARFFLSIAAAKKAAIEHNVVTIERRLRVGRAFILLQQLLEAGQIQPKEVASLLVEPPEEVFRLVSGMPFAAATEVMAIAKADLPDLENRPVKLGANKHLDGLTLGNASGEWRNVRTCAEYWAALEAGFYAHTTFEMKMGAFFEHQCGLLLALAGATMPVTSYVSEPRVGLPDLRLLPYSFFPSFGPGSDGVAPKPGVSYQDQVDAGVLVVKRVGSSELRVETSAMGQQLTEVVRADFDGDGLEDILVFDYFYAINGTLGLGTTALLSRQSADSSFEVSNPWSG